jgi:hypothetical protein
LSATLNISPWSASFFFFSFSTSANCSGLVCPPSQQRTQHSTRESGARRRAKQRCGERACVAAWLARRRVPALTAPTRLLVKLLLALRLGFHRVACQLDGGVQLRLQPRRLRGAAGGGVGSVGGRGGGAVQQLEQERRGRAWLRHEKGVQAAVARRRHARVLPRPQQLCAYEKRQTRTHLSGQSALCAPAAHATHAPAARSRRARGG